MDLTTARCRIRPFGLDDLDSLVKYANDVEVAAQLRDRFPHPYTYEIGRLFLASAAAGTCTESLAIEFEGEVIGGVGVHPGEDVARASAEIGYWLGRPFWGRGIASEIVGAVVDHLFGSAAYCRLHAHTFEGNFASQRVLGKCGFTREGVLRGAVLKNGRVIDAVIYGRIDEYAKQVILEGEALARPASINPAMRSSSGT